MFSNRPQFEKGEIWETHPAKPLKKNDQTIFLTNRNVTTSCIFKRELWEKGIRWETIPSESGNKFPADGKFSHEVKKLGYLVAWNDKYTVINWGHNVNEWKKNLDYYIRNYQSKKRVGLEGMQKRLRENGFKIIEINGKFEIVKN